MTVLARSQRLRQDDAIRAPAGATQPNRSRPSLDHPGQHADQRRLAGPVGTEQNRHRARRHVEADVIQHEAAAQRT